MTTDDKTATTHGLNTGDLATLRLAPVAARRLGDACVVRGRLDAKAQHVIARVNPGIKLYFSEVLVRGVGHGRYGTTRRSGRGATVATVIGRMERVQTPAPDAATEPDQIATALEQDHARYRAAKADAGPEAPKTQDPERAQAAKVLAENLRRIRAETPNTVSASAPEKTYGEPPGVVEYGGEFLDGAVARAADSADTKFTSIARSLEALLLHLSFGFAFSAVFPPHGGTSMDLDTQTTPTSYTAQRGGRRVTVRFRSGCPRHVTLAARAASVVALGALTTHVCDVLEGRVDYEFLHQLAVWARATQAES